MANAVKWATPANAVQLITDAEPADSALSVGSEVDNGTNKNVYGDFELQTTHASAPNVGAYFELWLVPSLDGTNYTDGTDGTVEPPSNLLVGVFPIRAVTSAQRVQLRAVLLPPFKFKPVVRNKTGQASSANTCQLYYRAYNEEVQ